MRPPERNYDTVLAEALRSRFTLAVFVNPALPDEAVFPHRITTPLIILLGLPFSGQPFR